MVQLVKGVFVFGGFTNFFLFLFINKILISQVHKPVLAHSGNLQQLFLRLIIHNNKREGLHRLSAGPLFYILLLMARSLVA